MDFGSLSLHSPHLSSLFMASHRHFSVEKRILECALKEFSQHGYAGARVARITRAAKVNAQMLFYYFGSKKNLFAAVLESIWESENLLENSPRTASEASSFWYRFHRENTHWTRMILWEGLERKKMEAAEEAKRRKTWMKHLDAFISLKGSNGWPDFGDPAHLLLSMVAIEAAPVAFPHIARLISGKDPASPEFIAGRDQFLREFVLFLTQRHKAKPRGRTNRTAPLIKK
jgi:TetR/AcrR family transcriptional regulator